MKISYRKMFDVRSSLQQLGDGMVERRVDQGVIREYYKLGAARIAIAANLNMLDKPAREFETLKRDLHVKHGSPNMQENAEEWAAFAAEIEKLADTEIDLDLIEISDSMLNLDQNEIPMSVLVPLFALKGAAPATSKKKR